MEKEKIYILHEYYTPSHFFALYDQEKKQNRYEIKDYIIISHKSLIKYSLKKFLKNKSILRSLKEYLYGLKKIYSLNKLRDKNLIVGIAPYSKLMKKYAKVFKNNNTVYFTSYIYWDNETKKVHSGLSREEFLCIVNTSMKGIACVSEETLRTISPLIKKNIKIRQVKHSIDVKNYEKKIFFNNDECKEKNVTKFLFLGQLIERKNVDKLIDWIKISNKNFIFDFAGKGNLENIIKELEKKDKRVRYLGQLKKESIKKILKDYDYLILTSKEEPYGIVLIEALTAGVPCIVSNAAGPREIIVDGYNGFVIKEEISSKSLENVIDRVYKFSKKEYKKMSINCLNESEKYSSEHLIKKWMKLILD